MREVAEYRVFDFITRVAVMERNWKQMMFIQDQENTYQVQ